MPLVDIPPLLGAKITIFYTFAVAIPALVMGGIHISDLMEAEKKMKELTNWEPATTRHGTVLIEHLQFDYLRNLVIKYIAGLMGIGVFCGIFSLVAVYGIATQSLKPLIVYFVIMLLELSNIGYVVGFVFDKKLFTETERIVTAALGAGVVLIVAVFFPIKEYIIEAWQARQRRVTRDWSEINKLESQRVAPIAERKPQKMAHLNQPGGFAPHYVP